MKRKLHSNSAKQLRVAVLAAYSKTKAYSTTFISHCCTKLRIGSDVFRSGLLAVHKVCSVFQVLISGNGVFYLETFVWTYVWEKVYLTHPQIFHRGQCCYLSLYLSRDSYYKVLSPAIHSESDLDEHISDKFESIKLSHS